MRRFLTLRPSGLSVRSFAVVGALALAFGLTTVASAQNGNKKVKTTTVTTTGVKTTPAQTNANNTNNGSNNGNGNNSGNSGTNNNAGYGNANGNNGNGNGNIGPDTSVGGVGEEGVPEIDPNSMAAALALLAGGVLCLTDPRRRQLA